MVRGSLAADDGGRSGGKILKRRPTAARKTPYDRPAPQPQNPSWLHGLVFPAKFVAGGATKILSSFWNPTTWASPSSSSDTGSDSDGVEDDYEDDENPCDEVVELNQKKGSSSGKSETLDLIEQLLMLEHYSREECDSLIEIINSRVVDYSMRDGVEAGPSKIQSITNKEAPGIQSQAIMEARKWVAEKKVGGLDNGIYALKSVMTPNITEGEAGSAVDVARSYMQARPPWESPISHNDSPLRAHSSRDYGGGGSWNIEEEIRRLRSKDLLPKSVDEISDTGITQDVLPTPAKLVHEEYQGTDSSIGKTMNPCEVVTEIPSEGLVGKADGKKRAATRTSTRRGRGRGRGGK